MKNLTLDRRIMAVSNHGATLYRISTYTSLGKRVSMTSINWQGKRASEPVPYHLLDLGRA